MVRVCLILRWKLNLIRYFVQAFSLENSACLTLHPKPVYMYGSEALILHNYTRDLPNSELRRGNIRTGHNVGLLASIEGILIMKTKNEQGIAGECIEFGEKL